MLGMGVAGKHGACRQLGGQPDQLEVHGIRTGQVVPAPAPAVRLGDWNEVADWIVGGSELAEGQQGRVDVEGCAQRVIRQPLGAQLRALGRAFGLCAALAHEATDPEPVPGFDGAQEFGGFPGRPERFQWLGSFPVTGHGVAHPEARELRNHHLHEVLADPLLVETHRLRVPGFRVGKELRRRPEQGRAFSELERLEHE